MITETIQKLVDRSDLTPAEARAAMEGIMTGKWTDAQVAAFLTALRMKGETATELVSFARVMREKAERFWDGDAPAVLDTAGTGGDYSGTFNISTAAAFVAAGAGVRVAKHGNRSASSRCGSADVMEALGVDIQMPIERLRRAVAVTGIGFLFAQRFHRSMKYVAPARAQLKIRTVFNILGPLANPAAARFQVVGVASPEVIELMSQALIGLEVRHAFVVYGEDGVDEISISAQTHVTEINGGEVRTYSVSPEDFGIPRSSAGSIRGGDARENAAIIESVLRGQHGPHRDVVLLNAAAAIAAGGSAEDLRDGIRVAAASIDSGAALQKLTDLRQLS